MSERADRSTPDSSTDTPAENPLGEFYDLSELVEAPRLQALMDDFYRLTNTPMALIALDGAVIVGAGWQDVCIEFHRKHPTTCAHCVESDTALTAEIPEGEAKLYRCKNGMWDAATPVVVGGQRVGNLFTGQFFFDDESIDLEFFGEQADRYGFDKERYLAALHDVPRLSRESVEIGLRYLAQLSVLISELSLSNLERVRSEERLQSALAEEREAARLNAAIARIDQRIHGTLELHGLLDRAVEEAAEALGCESSALDLREDADWVIHSVYRFPTEAIGQRFSDAEVPFAAMAAATQGPVVVDDAFDDPRVDPEVQQAYGVRSVMVTPLIVQEDVLGLLFFNYHSELHRFTEQEVEFARRLSASLSLAIANARLFESEHLIASRLQEALLALPSDIPGIEVAYAYRASTDTARVGGDFYDLFAVGDHHVGITIGDVAGKGLDAAALTSRAKNTVRAYAFEQDRSPSRVLALTNDVLYAGTPSESFVTLFFAILDCRDGTLEYANAGHTTAAIMKGHRAPARLPSTGPILGAFPQVAFDHGETKLDSREVLVLYTDGLTEARGDGGFYGEERLFDLLSRSEGEDVTSVVEDLVQEVLSFSAGRLTDDLAILAVRRRGD